MIPKLTLDERVRRLEARMNILIGQMVVILIVLGLGVVF